MGYCREQVIARGIVVESESVNQVDKEFNRVINVEVRTDIAKAFLMLDTNLKEGLMSVKSEEERKKLLLKKASQCKDMLNEYIDLLVKTTLKADFEEDVGGACTHIIRE